MPEEGYANLFEDAATSIGDITYERVSYTHRLQFGGVDKLEARYVIRNGSDRRHSVVPIGILHWESDRYSKRVVDESGNQLAFLGSEVIRDAMAEAASRAIFEAALIAGMEVDQDQVENLRWLLAIPKADHDDEWRAAVDDAFIYIAALIREVKRRLDRTTDSETDEHHLLREARWRLGTSFDILSLAAQDYYIALVLLRRPIEPEDGNLVADTRQFVATSTPIWLDAPKRGWNTWREGLRTFPRLVRDLCWPLHESRVSFRVSEVADSAHMRVVAPEGTHMLYPRATLPDGMIIRNLSSKRRLLALLEEDLRPAGWHAKTRKDYRFVRRADHIGKRGKELAQSWWTENPPRAGERVLQPSSVFPWLTKYALRARYREPVAVYSISVVTAVLVVAIGLGIGAGVLKIGAGVLSVLALMVATWFGGHEEGLRRILSLRFGVALLTGFVAGAIGWWQAETLGPWIRGIFGALGE